MDGSENGPDPTTDAYGHLQAERELRKLVIATERTELDQRVARWKISERIADGVRAALDVDETTRRPGTGTDPARVAAPVPNTLQGASEETPCRYICAD